MITLKSPREIEAMEKAGAALASMHIGIRQFIKPGISSWEVEDFARKYFMPVLRLNKLASKGTNMQPVSVLMMKFVTVSRGRSLSLKMAI